MNKRHFLISAIALAGLTACRSQPPASTQSYPAPTVERAFTIELAVLKRVNQERQNLGLSQFAMDADLLSIARAHSADMNTRDYFDHIDPDGKQPLDRVPETTKARITKIGENLWVHKQGGAEWTVEEHADRILNGWMGSEFHRANIVDPEFDMAAVGVDLTPKGFYLTMLYARRR